MKDARRGWPERRVMRRKGEVLWIRELLSWVLHLIEALGTRTMAKWQKNVKVRNRMKMFTAT